MVNIDGFEMLANAIIMKALEDYEKYTYIITKKNDNTLNNHMAIDKAISEKKKIRKFINSDYYTMLTKVDKNIMLKELDRLDKGGEGLWRKQLTNKLKKY